MIALWDDSETRFKDEAMAKEVEYRGLCLTCSNAPSCAFLGQFSRPVLQCEQFECLACRPAGSAGEQDSPSDSTIYHTASREDDDSDLYIGLCKTCDERDSCKFTRPESGVWHCEEYR